MYNTKVISLNNQIEWKSTLDRMKKYDFYHSYSYNCYYCKNSEKPLLICFKKDQFEITFPLIIRKIDSTYQDITSVYGYSGLLTSHDNLPEDLKSEFRDSLNFFFQKNNIVSVFSRLHPSFLNDDFINGLGNVVQLNPTAYIDLSLDPDFQLNKYRKDTRYNIKKLTRNGFYIFEDTGKQHIREFVEIYNENMVRVGARPEYFFDDAYYNMIFNSPDIDSKLFFVVKDNVKVAASIFVFTGDIIQYHLSGTRGDYLKNSPVRLIIDHVRIYGTENGYKELHLGGGVGSSEDSLFKFKAGFSDCRHQFKVWRHIVNPTIYNQLVKEHNPHPNSTYFPLYRSPN